MRHPLPCAACPCAARATPHAMAPRYDDRGMAQIRIVDDWRRSPASGPSHWRSVMVIAEKWAEQRVLMRAYAESRDQLRPTIMLYGIELAIGPAGLELNGPWGIHVGENPDGRAPAIKEQLEASARRLAGSKGNPPRLADEVGTFDREPTANWNPGAPRILPRRPDPAPLGAGPAGNLPPRLSAVFFARMDRAPRAMSESPVPRRAARRNPRGRMRHRDVR